MLFQESVRSVKWLGHGNVHEGHENSYKFLVMKIAVKRLLERIMGRHADTFKIVVKEMHFEGVG
jgi:hypothetical protein